MSRMKIKLLFLCACVICFVSRVYSSELSVLNMTQSPLFDWVNHGEVFFVQSKTYKSKTFTITNVFGEEEKILSGGGPLELNIAYLFRDEDGVICMISRNVVAASSFINCQLDERGRAERFVHDELVYVVARLFSERNFNVISDAYINMFCGTSAGYFGGGVAIEDIDYTRLALKRYRSNVSPHVSDGKWSLSVYIHRGDGGVDQLVANGCIYPFEILACDVKECEPKGTYVVIPVM